MTARCVGRRRLFFSFACVAGVVAAAGRLLPACYSGGGGGTSPPQSSLYFPVGLAVSPGGKILYVANSDFDLQFNGGTLQSYDLRQMRIDAQTIISSIFSHALSLPDGSGIDVLSPNWSPPACWAPSGVPTNPNGTRLLPGETCAPPVNPNDYIKQTVTIGAFATQLQITDPPQPRLFAPVRGNASLTWANVDSDFGLDAAPLPDAAMFEIHCGQDSQNRCQNQAGNTVAPGDTRGLTMPGEPFGLALTQDQTAALVTHQSSNQTSVLTTGLQSGTRNPAIPAMQFILSGVPTGGDGIAAVPHDDSKHSPVPGCEVADPGQTCVRPAFFETNHSTAEIDLIRYYSDDGSSQQRPFLAREVVYPLTSQQGGTDTRGIAIDPTPRMACRYRVHPGDPATSDPCNDSPNSVDCQKWIACGTVPSRVFIASRTPPSLIVGTVGGPSASGDGTFDPDRLTITGNKPLTVGPSTVYLAPIVDSQGKLALRVFIVCFDSNQVFIYDPDAQTIENIVNVGAGPFAMAFDPFVFWQVAAHLGVGGPADLHDYRFAYLALFTTSYLQMIDLDNSIRNPAISLFTFENVVFTLGTPTQPKGT
jgi:DNA-binding beta-propeller fold protein YncE